MQRIYERLFDYCSWDWNKKVKSLLDQYDNLDLTRNDGIYFSLSIKHSNLKIFNLLLDYFENKQISQYKIGSAEYKELRSKIENILEDAIASFDISDDIWPILGKYCLDTRLIDAVEKKDVSLVENLLSQGTVDINFQDEDTGNTALHLAYYNNAHDIVELLLEAGADTDITNDNGFTAKELDTSDISNIDLCQDLKYETMSDSVLENHNNGLDIDLLGAENPASD